MTTFATNIGDLLSLVLRNHVFRIAPDSPVHPDEWVSILEIEPTGEVCVKTLAGECVFSIPPRFLRRTFN